MKTPWLFCLSFWQVRFENYLSFKVFVHFGRKMDTKVKACLLKAIIGQVCKIV